MTESIPFFKTSLLCDQLNGVTTTNNNNNLFEKEQNKWLVPQMVTKLIKAGQDEYRNAQEK